MNYRSLTNNSNDFSEEWQRLPLQWIDAVNRYKAIYHELGLDFDSNPPPCVKLLELTPLVEAMSQFADLRKLFPFTSHYTLRLSNFPLDQLTTPEEMGNHPSVNLINHNIFEVTECRFNAQTARWDTVPVFRGSASEAAKFVAEIVKNRLANITAT